MVRAKYQISGHKDFLVNNESAVISGFLHFYGKIGSYMVLYKSIDKITTGFEITAGIVKN